MEVPGDATALALQRSQEMLTAALRELADANDAKDRFIAMLSHELRNPLAAIASSVELLAPAAATPDQRCAGEIARRQAEALKVLLDDLLDVTRVRQGQLRLHNSRVLLDDVVRRAEAGTAAMLRTRRYASELPPEAVELEGDAVRLAQVVTNLLSNAAKYTPAGGTILLRAHVRGGRLELDVQDEGAGIEPDDLERIFAYFVRARGREHGDGLGVGLALARSIAELHGGSLRAASAGPGRGSTFTLSLPVAAPSPAAAPSSGCCDDASPRPPGEGRILLVDDNEDAAWAVGTLLRQAGYSVLAASTGAQALQAIERHRPAVVLLDLHLPDMHGHQVGRRLRELPGGRDVTVIAVTGYGQAADLQRSEAAGFDAHLTKPVNIAALRAVLQRAQARRRG